MRSVLVHWVIGSLLLLACWGGASPLVLCVGSQGHSALENPLAGCCEGPEGCGTAAGDSSGLPVNGLATGHTDSLPVATAPEEGSCLDAPLPLWQTSSDPPRPPGPPPTVSACTVVSAPPSVRRAIEPRRGAPDESPSPPLDRKTVLRI